MGTGRKMGTSLQKGVKKFYKKVLRNLSMGTGRKMGTSLQKGVKKFVNGYRAKNGNVFAKRC